MTVAGVNAEGLPMLLFGIDSEAAFYTWGYSAGVWMLAAEGVEMHAKQLARESRPWVQALLTTHGPLTCGHNIVDARNALHVRWLKWCGAEFTGAEYFPTDPDLPFLEFYISPCATQLRPQVPVSPL